MKTNRISSLYSCPPSDDLGPVEHIEPIFSSALEQQQVENDPVISLWKKNGLACYNYLQSSDKSGYPTEATTNGTKVGPPVTASGHGRSLL